MSMTVAEKMIAYFAANPDDFLTSADAALKFDLPNRSSVWRAGMQLTQRGLLELSKGTRGPHGKEPDIYAAGPELKRLIGKD